MKNKDKYSCDKDPAQYLLPWLDNNFEFRYNNTNNINSNDNSNSDNTKFQTNTPARWKKLITNLKVPKKYFFVA